MTEGQTLEGLVWHTEQRKINDLVPMPNNPRILTSKQKEDLTKSLQKFNLMSIPVINTDNMVVSGHQRLKILQLLGRGDEVIDVRVPNRTLTRDELREANIRENKNTGEWDWELLATEFLPTELLDWGFNQDEFGKASAPQFENAEGKEPTEAAGAEASHVRMVQLFFNTETHPVFMDAVEKLQKKYGTDNITDTVFKAVQEAVSLG